MCIHRKVPYLVALFELIFRLLYSSLPAGYRLTMDSFTNMFLGILTLRAPSCCILFSSLCFSSGNFGQLTPFEKNWMQLNRCHVVTNQNLRIIFITYSHCNSTLTWVHSPCRLVRHGFGHQLNFSFFKVIPLSGRACLAQAMGFLRHRQGNKIELSERLDLLRRFECIPNIQKLCLQTLFSRCPTRQGGRSDPHVITQEIPELGISQELQKFSSLLSNKDRSKMRATLTSRPFL